MASHVRAVTSFIANVKDVDVIVGHGQVLAATDPIVKQHPELFEPDTPKSGAA